MSFSSTSSVICVKKEAISPLHNFSSLNSYDLSQQMEVKLPQTLTLSWLELYLKKHKKQPFPCALSPANSQTVFCVNIEACGSWNHSQYSTQHIIKKLVGFLWIFQIFFISAIFYFFPTAPKWCWSTMKTSPSNKAWEQMCPNITVLCIGWIFGLTFNICIQTGVSYLEPNYLFISFKTTAGRRLDLKTILAAWADWKHSQADFDVSETFWKQVCFFCLQLHFFLQIIHKTPTLRNSSYFYSAVWCRKLFDTKTRVSV